MTPVDTLDAEQRQFLAEIARRQLDRLLASALDAADLLVELADDDERREAADMIRTSIRATILLRP